MVSIPSSSGHQFTAQPGARRALQARPCFNPFFIRASVYCPGGCLFEGLASVHGFNPFFIRASVYWPDIAILGRLAPRSVSIPSSSGHQFTEWPSYRSRKTSFPSVSIPSSSGHQFTGHKKRLLNALGFLLFQSLLHQGISLLRTRGPVGVVRDDAVSIPSSSGHQFTDWRRRSRPWHSCPRFNPFFIRASVYCRFNQPRVIRAPIPVSIPSSSGHQFTGRQRLAQLIGCAVVSIPSSSGHQFTVCIFFPL